MRVRHFLLLAVVSLSAQALDYRTEAKSIDHKIVAVTAFSDQAEVVRTGTLRATPGETWVRLRGLPAGLDRGSLKVDLSSSRGKILQVVLEQSFEHVALDPKVRSQLATLKKDLARLLDLSQSHQNQTREIGFLKGLEFEKPFPKGKDARAFDPFSASVQSLASAFRTVRTSVAKAQNQDREDRERIRELEEDIDHQLRELQNITQRREQKWIGNLYVLLKNDRAWKGTLSARYRMPKAKWTPLYDVRADLDRKRGTANIKLVTAGQIEQHTGESWNQVRLKVSTRDPAPLWLPPLDRWVLGETRIEAKRAMKSFGRGGAPPASAPIAGAGADLARESSRQSAIRSKPQKNRAKKMATQGMLQESAEEADASWSPSDRATVTELYPLKPLEQIFPKYAQVKRSLASLETPRHRPLPLTPGVPASHSPGRLAQMTGGRVIELESPFRIDLKSDEAPLKVPLSSQVLKGDLLYLTIPKKDPKVYLQAKTTNATQQPILAGQAQVFMNGDLITKTALPTISEKGTFRVDLGVDENVETKRTVDRKSETSGMLSKTHTTQVTVRLEVANHHGFPIQVRLQDQHPLSPGDDIELKLIKTEPQIQPSSHGLLTWETRVPAKSKQKFSFVYQVEHPDNYLVSEFN